MNLSLKLNKNFYLSSILLGLIAGWLIKEPLFPYFSNDPSEYCEIDGAYHQDAGKIYEVIEKDGYTLRAMDYAYVCNINELNIKEVSQFKDFTKYGVTKGNVKQIPKDIAKLKNLTTLQVHDQEIDNLPPEIGELTDLINLKLGGNKLKYLPKEIGNLTNLEVLHLYDNELASLPKEIDKLEKLRILDLHSNRLKSLPTEIGALADSLHRLYLGGNNLSEEEKQRIKNLLPKTVIYF